jgi:RNA polymerase sigma-70 factor, ECF subfamily
MATGGADLIRDMAGGSREAFVCFYDRYGPFVYPLVLRILGDPGDAAEVLRDVFWDAWRRADSYDAARATPEAWLITRARMHAIDRMRSARRRRELPLGERSSSPVTSAPPDPVFRPLDRSILSRAFERLPDPQREALELAYYGGLTQTEITARLKQPLGTVKTRIRLGIDRLRDMVKPG